MPPDPASEQVSGRCYCGKTTFRASAPAIVTYCHCSDCRRWTGAPLPAFAGFEAGAFDTIPRSPNYSQGGVDRWNCPACGSPFAARFDYLPGQIYVPLGLLDQVADYPPTLHCHAGSQLPWLHVADDIPRQDASGRDTLNATTNEVQP